MRLQALFLGAEFHHSLLGANQSAANRKKLGRKIYGGEN